MRQITKLLDFIGVFVPRITTTMRNKPEYTELRPLSGSLWCKSGFFGCRRTRKNIVIWLIFAESQNFLYQELHFPQNFDFSQDCFRELP